MDKILHVNEIFLNLVQLFFRIRVTKVEKATLLAPNELFYVFAVLENAEGRDEPVFIGSVFDHLDGLRVFEFDLVVLDNEDGFLSVSPGLIEVFRANDVLHVPDLVWNQSVVNFFITHIISNFELEVSVHSMVHEHSALRLLSLIAHEHVEAVEERHDLLVRLDELLLSAALAKHVLHTAVQKKVFSHLAVQLLY